MDYTNLSNVDKNTQYYFAEENSSALRKTMSNFMRQQDIRINGYGDVFIEGTAVYSIYSASFSDLAKFFIFRGYICLATKDDGSSYLVMRNKINKREFISKLDLSMVKFRNHKTKFNFDYGNEEYVWIWKYSLTDEFNLFNKKAVYEVESIGPFQHPYVSEKTHCYFITNPDDLD
jgi:hypothetical protein